MAILTRVLVDEDEGHSSAVAAQFMLSGVKQNANDDDLYNIIMSLSLSQVTINLHSSTIPASDNTPHGKGFPHIASHPFPEQVCTDVIKRIYSRLGVFCLYMSYHVSCKNALKEYQGVA